MKFGMMGMWLVFQAEAIGSGDATAIAEAEAAVQSAAVKMEYAETLTDQAEEATITMETWTETSVKIKEESAIAAEKHVEELTASVSKAMEEATEKAEEAAEAKVSDLCKLCEENPSILCRESPRQPLLMLTSKSWRSNSR